MATRISSRIRNKQNIADILSNQSAAACVTPRKSQASKKKEKEEAKAAAKEKILLSNSLIAEQLDAQAKENHALLRPDMEPMERAKGQLLMSTDSEANLTEQVDSCGSVERIGFPMSSPVDGPMLPASGNTSQCPDIPMTENNEDDEDERTIQNLEEELRRIKEKKKADKTAVRDAISAVRAEPPKSLVLNTTLGAKRPLTDAVATSVKRTKTIQVGGLKPNWKEVINQARTSSHLSSNLKPANEDRPTDIDEFGVDESPQALQVQRAGKSHGTKHFQGLPEVKFEPVDVDMIAKEEIETGKPAQPPKKRVTTKVSDIPYVNAGDRDVMNHKILPAMIRWVGGREKQFAINGDPLLRSTIRKIWLDCFQSLPPNCTGPRGDTILRCDHPAIHAFLQTKLRAYRSNFGKMGAAAVTLYLKELCDANEECEFAKDLLENDAFIYEVLGDTLETCSGAFRSELVLRTFAFHLTWSLSATKEPAKPEDELVPAPHIVYPSGALALAATAVYWALNLRANGTVSAGIEGSGGEENSDVIAATPSKTKPKNKPKSASSIARNNENSFGEKLSREYNKYQAHTSKLTEAKWNLIINASKRYILNVPNSGAGPALKVALEEARTNFSVDDEGGSELDTGIREERRRQDVIMLSDD